MYNSTELPLPSKPTFENGNKMSFSLERNKIIVQFIKKELNNTSEILQYIINGISMEVKILSGSKYNNLVEENLFHIAEFIQCEDRIQQRLRDVITALNVLQKTFDSTDCDDSDQLTQSIVDQFFLEEMKYSLASMANIDSDSLNVQPARSPSLGEVDLF